MLLLFEEAVYQCYDNSRHTARFVLNSSNSCYRLLLSYIYVILVLNISLVFVNDYNPMAAPQMIVPKVFATDPIRAAFIHADEITLPALVATQAFAFQLAFSSWCCA